MNKPKKKELPGNSTIANNRKARFNYHIEDHLEVGLCLEGWEVKALRAGNANLSEAYIFIKNREVFITGCHITPLATTSKHTKAEPNRMRKLLLNRYEIDRLAGAVDRKGYSLIPLSLYWSKGRAKLRLGLAKGKKQHDKRADIKQRDWSRRKSRLLKNT
ncbi:MAG: SsrA-binding protein SmpB [Pseudomonadota bacterium]|nr:SsrA-binding protein SmpB [Pseudomonadota bacterium]